MKNISYAVIIPAFNAAKTIGETLEAIQRQTLPPSTIYVIDDQSTDATEEVVHALHNQSIEFRKLPSNSGSAALPRNHGLELCGLRYDYVAFCDADDVWAPQKMQVQLACMQEFLSDFSFTDVVKFWSTPNISGVDQPPLGVRTVTLKDFQFDNLIKSGSSVVIGKRAISHINFPIGKEFRGVEDYYAWLRAISIPGMHTHHIKAPLVHYRQFSGSVSASKLYMHRTRRRTFNFKSRIMESSGIPMPGFYISEAMYFLHQIIRHRNSKMMRNIF